MREKAGIWNLTTFLIDLQIWNLWPFLYTEKRKIPTAVQQCPVPVKYVATGKRLWVPLKYLISCKAGIGVSGDRVGLSLILYSLTSNSIYMIWCSSIVLQSSWDWLWWSCVGLDQWSFRETRMSPHSEKQQPHKDQ